MPHAVWEADLAGSLKKLLKGPGQDFWCSGRMLVQLCRMAVPVVNGVVGIVTRLRLLDSPHIVSVRPMALPAGKETEIVIHGYGISKPGTQIFCAYQGRYYVNPVTFLSNSGEESMGGDDGSIEDQEAMEDDFEEMWEDDDQPQLEEQPIIFSGGEADEMGRAFLEVVHGDVTSNFAPFLAGPPEI